MLECLSPSPQRPSWEGSPARKHLISLVVATAAGLSAGIVQAKEAASDTASPHRAAREDEDCNAYAKAGNKKGAVRKAFMKECLSNKK